MTTKSFPSVRSKIQFERERDLEILRRRILDVIAAQTSVTAPKLAAAIPDVKPQRLYELCRRMCNVGKLVSVRINSKKGQHVVWALTEADLADAHTRHPIEPVDGMEDDANWRPQPWIHPIRRRALGL